MYSAGFIFFSWCEKNPKHSSASTMKTWSTPEERMERPVDMHVHIVGNGSSGSGCWLRVKGWHWPMAAFMCRHIGLPLKALSGDFDQLYVQRLVRLARESSLGAVVILAHELV